MLTVRKWTDSSGVLWLAKLVHLISEECQALESSHPAVVSPLPREQTSISKDYWSLVELDGLSPF